MKKSICNAGKEFISLDKWLNYASKIVFFVTFIICMHNPQVRITSYEPSIKMTKMMILDFFIDPMLDNSFILGGEDSRRKAR